MTKLVLILLSTIVYSNSDTLTLDKSFGKFQNAVSISVAREQFIFVSDVTTNQIYKFSTEGKLLLNSGGTGSGDNELKTPLSIDASNGLNLFVCDYDNNRVKNYDLNLNYIGSFNFNVYNQTAEISKQIYYPRGISFLSSSEIFVLADASNYKIVKLNSLESVDSYYGNSDFETERIKNPTKIIKGRKLDFWILDKSLDELLNFSNLGTLTGRLANKMSSPIISIAFYGENLYIVYNNSILIYDTSKGQFTQSLDFNLGKDSIVDIGILDKENILLLTTNQILKFKLNQK